MTIDSGHTLKINDLATVYCKNELVKKSILDLHVNSIDNNRKTQVISALKIIDIIENNYKDVSIIVLGGPEILLEITDKPKISPFIIFLKIFIVSVVIFFGTALAIINFHEDVNMDQSLDKIYYLLTGEKNNNPRILYIPYSLGIGLGMFTFFNNFLGKKCKQEPSPLDVEMHLYDKNIQDYILDNNKDDRKMR